MTIFRNIKNKRLYKLFKVRPHGHSPFTESEDLITGETRKLNASSWKREDFVRVAHR